MLTASPTRLEAAVHAWGSLGVPGTHAPSRIDVLAERDKSAVYRLDKAGPRDVPVVAKRCRPETAALERRFYEKILPELPITVPRYFGSCDLTDEGILWTWLFLEDVEGAVYSHHDPLHGALVAQWLAELHGAAVAAAVGLRLPNRTAAHFLVRLRAARTVMDARLAESQTDETRRLYESVIDQCNALDRCWATVTELAECLPQTVVHGDMAALNIRVRGGVLCAFDWEKAGWGTPALDFVRGLSIDDYRRTMERWYPSVTNDEVETAARVARILRPLTHTWAVKTDEKIDAYRRHMASAMDELGVG